MALKPGNGGAQRENGGRDPRLDLLYRDAARETPPAHLDAAILAAARREVGARPRPLSTQLRRWRLPVSIAAVVVLSVSLVSLIGEKSPDPLMIELLSTAEPPMARTGEPQVQPAAPGKQAEDYGQRAPTAAYEMFSTRRDEAPAKAPAERPADPAKAPETRKRAAVSAPEELSLRRDEAAAMTEAETRRAAEQARLSAATAAPKSAAEGDARSSAEPVAGPETGAAPPAVASGGWFSYYRQESAPRPAADESKPPPTTAIGGGVLGLEIAPPAAAPQPKPLADKKVRVEARALPAKRPPAWHGLEQEPPQKWLERLKDLRKQGRTGEADELLTEFKRRFPDQPLPAGTE